jgi:methionine aminotransferase
MQRLADLLRPTDVIVIADEVYEHMVYDGARTRASRASRARGAQLRRVELRQDLPRDRLEGRLRRRAGRADGRVPQGAPVQRVHRQHAGAARPRRLHGRPGALPRLPAFYQRKRDLFRAGLAARASAAAQRGQLLPVRRLLGDQRRERGSVLPRLTREVGVAAIPLSAFYPGGFEQRIVRFCFAKQDGTLSLALERLARL